MTRKIGLVRDKFPELREWWSSTNAFGFDDAMARHKNVYDWVCSEGHVWSSSLHAVGALGSRCPFCAGQKLVVGLNDVASRFPDLVPSWSCLNEVTTEETMGGPTLFWWDCPEGHVYQARVSDRARGRGCSVCSGQVVVAGVNDLASTCPWLVGEWSDKNEIRPAEVTPGSDVQVEWVCDKGHRWVTSPRVRVRLGQGAGCRLCVPGRQSRLELRLWSALADLVDDLVVDLRTDVRWSSRGWASVDAGLLTQRVAIEYDGFFWHEQRAASDLRKTRALLDAGWVVLRVREQPLPSLGVWDGYFELSCPRNPSELHLKSVARSLATLVVGVAQ